VCHPVQTPSFAISGAHTAAAKSKRGGQAGAWPQMHPLIIPHRCPERSSRSFRPLVSPRLASPSFHPTGIKKQACVNRKCLMMMPRDVDEEETARKRAKQRTLPPPLNTGGRIGFAARGTADELAMIAAAAGSPLDSPLIARECESPRSDASSPELRIGSCAIVANPTDPEEAARAQALSEAALFSLAVDDDEETPRGRSLTSAMLFAAIQTPVPSPVRPSVRAAPLVTSVLPADGADATDASPRAKRCVELDLDEDGGVNNGASTNAATVAVPAQTAQSAQACALQAAKEAALSAAFTATIAAKLELDEPPKPPRLDELHEEFLLLNALHRENKLTVHPLHAEPVPVLAF